jgi:hypothetical protein
MRDAIGCSARRLGSIEENPGEKGTRLIRSSVKPLLLLSCAEHAPHLFCKLGKDLEQNAVGSTVAILASRLFHVSRRRILARLGQSKARSDRTHRLLGFHGWRDRRCLRLLFHAGA